MTRERLILSGRGHTGCLSDGRGQVSLLSRFQQNYFDQHCSHHFCYHHPSKHQKHHHHNFIELSISLSLIPVMSRDIVSVRPPHQEPGPSKAGKKRNRWSWSACFTYQVHHHQSLPLLPFTIDIITIQNMLRTKKQIGGVSSAQRHYQNCNHVIIIFTSQDFVFDTLPKAIFAIRTFASNGTGARKISGRTSSTVSIFQSHHNLVLQSPSSSS